MFKISFLLCIGISLLILSWLLRSSEVVIAYIFRVIFKWTNDLLKHPYVCKCVQARNDRFGLINVAGSYMCRLCIITRMEGFLSFGAGHIGVRFYLLGMPCKHRLSYT